MMLLTEHERNVVAILRDTCPPVGTGRTVSEHDLMMARQNDLSKPSVRQSVEITEPWRQRSPRRPAPGSP